MKRSRKSLFVLLLLVLVVAITCGTLNAAKQITLTVWDFKYADPDMNATMVKIDKMFMKEHPNVKINHVSQPDDQYYQILRAAAQANRGPDVVMLHGARGDVYELDPD